MFNKYKKIFYFTVSCVTSLAIPLTWMTSCKGQTKPTIIDSSSKDYIKQEAQKYVVNHLSDYEKMFIGQDGLLNEVNDHEDNWYDIHVNTFEYNVQEQKAYCVFQDIDSYSVAYIPPTSDKSFGFGLFPFFLKFDKDGSKWYSIRNINTNRDDFYLPETWSNPGNHNYWRNWNVFIQNTLANIQIHYTGDGNLEW